MTLTKEEMKKINFLVRKANNKDLKRVKILTEKRISSDYLKDFKHICKDIKKKLKEDGSIFSSFSGCVFFFERKCLDDLGISHDIFKKAINHLKQTGEIYEQNKETLRIGDAKNIKLLKEQLEKMKLAKEKNEKLKKRTIIPT